MALASYRWLFIGLTCCGLVADQTSKYAVFRWLYQDGQWHEGHGNSYEVVPGWFKLIAQFEPSRAFSEGWRGWLQQWNAPVMPRVNHGALFGMGQSHQLRANAVFAAISAVAAGLVLVWGWQRSVAQDPWLSAALGLILAGTLGNFYDRLVFFGVRDFLYFYKIEWPVFNVADCCLVCGATLLFLHAFLSATSADTYPPSTSAPLTAATADTPAHTAHPKASLSVASAMALSSLSTVDSPVVLPSPNTDSTDEGVASKSTAGSAAGELTNASELTTTAGPSPAKTTDNVDRHNARPEA
jgi:lipoprotein signal peptidase